MKQPDALALQFLLTNRWQQIRAVLSQHLLNVLILMVILIFAIGLQTNATWQWPEFLQRPNVLAMRDGLIVFSTILLAAKGLSWRRAQVNQQRIDWLASTPTHASGRARFAAAMAASRLSIWWPMLLLLAMALQYPLWLALCSSVIGIGSAALVVLLWPLRWLEQNPGTSARHADKALRNTNRQATLPAALANLWRACLPSAALRARWWFLPLLIVPAGISTWGLCLLMAILFVGLQIIHQLQAALPFAQRISALQASLPIAASAIYRQLTLQFTRQSATHWLAAIALGVATPLPWHAPLMVIAAAMLICAWQLHLCFAARLRASRLPWLALHYSTWLIITAAIAPVLLPALIIGQCLFLYQTGCRPQDIE